MSSTRRAAWPRLGVLCFLPGLVFAAAVPAPGASAQDAATEDEAVFEMREVSVFDRSESRAFHRLVRGQYAKCETEPHERVEAYSKLKSERPYYGTTTFGRHPYEPGSGREFHFVIDESGKAPATAKQKPDDAEAKEKAEEKGSLLEMLSSALLGTDKSNRK